MKMGQKCEATAAFAVILLMLASMAALNQAATKIVGGPNQWKFGYNYVKWARQNRPFYQNDTLVFKYEPPSTTIFPHSVYLLKDHKSYRKCDFKNGTTLLANPTQGGGSGFKFLLGKRKHYYFACGVGNGAHCNAGHMKFSVKVKPLKKHIF